MKLGIIGKGNFSDKVFNYIQRSTPFDVTNGLETGNEGNIECVKNTCDLLKKVDTIIILDPIYCDFNTIEMVVKNGIHIYIESPGLLSYSDLERIQMLALESGSLVQIGLKERFYNLYNDLDKYNAIPRIIDTNRYLKFSKNSTHFSVIDDLMLHDIGVAIRLTQSEIKNIQSTAVGLYCNQPDVVNTRLEFYNGAIANISVSKIANKDRHDTKFFAENIYCSINFQEKYLKVQRNEGGEALDEIWGVCTTYTLVKNSNEYLTILGNELNSFYHCIQNGLEAISGIPEYLQILLIAEKIKLQLERNFISKP